MNPQHLSQVLAAALILSISVPAVSASYVVTDLGPVSGPFSTDLTEVTGVNAHARVIGNQVYDTGFVGLNVSYAFEYGGGTWMGLKYDGRGLYQGKRH